MYASQYEEHVAHSAPCSSRWDGFDRGDRGDEGPDQGRCIIGRMTNGGGYRVTITELWCEGWEGFEVHVGEQRVHSTDRREDAVAVARWWMAGCPV